MPPSRGALHAFAQAVCASLSERQNDPELESKEAIAGLTQFLEVVTRIQAKYMSNDARDLIDTDPKPE